MLTFSCRWLSRREGGWERWLVTKDKHVWSLSFTTQEHWPTCPSHLTRGVAGQGRAWDFKYCGEGQSRGRKEVKSAWLPRRSFSMLNLFILLWVGPSIFCVFFLFGIISYSLSRDDLFLNLLLERSSLICRVLTLSFQENWRQDLWITSGWREHDLCKNWMDAEMSKYSLLSSIHLLDPGDWWTGCLWEQVEVLYEIFAISGLWGVKYLSIWDWSLSRGSIFPYRTVKSGCGTAPSKGCGFRDARNVAQALVGGLWFMPGWDEAQSRSYEWVDVAKKNLQGGRPRSAGATQMCECELQPSNQSPINYQLIKNMQ